MGEQKSQASRIEISGQNEVLLKQFGLEDSEELFKLYQANAQDLEPDDIYVPEEEWEIESMVTHPVPADRLYFAIYSNDELAGVADIFLDTSGKVELTYWVDRLHRRQGIATNALRALSDYVFNSMGVPTIAASVKDENGTSKRTLEKLGFRPASYNERAKATRYELSKPIATAA